MKRSVGGRTHVRRLPSRKGSLLNAGRDMSHRLCNHASASAMAGRHFPANRLLRNLMNSDLLRSVPRFKDSRFAIERGFAVQSR